METETCLKHMKQFGQLEQFLQILPTKQQKVLEQYGKDMQQNGHYKHAQTKCGSNKQNLNSSLKYSKKFNNKKKNSKKIKPHKCGISKDTLHVS